MSIQTDIAEVPADEVPADDEPRETTPPCGRPRRVRESWRS
jgi:hypothetical protein